MAEEATTTEATTTASTTEPKPAKTETTTTASTESASDYDWRGAIAGEDKKLAKRLERFTDLNAFGKSYFEADARLNSGKLLQIPGDDASDEERGAWAKARKIPETHDKYEIKAKPPEGYEVTEADKTRLDALTKRFHARGGIYADPSVVSAIHEAYYAEQEEAQAIAQATALRQAELTKAQIAKLWPGAEGQRNVNFAKSAAEAFFGKTWEDLKDLQFTDGSLLGDNFEFIQAFAKIGRLTMEDPVFTEAGKNGGDPVKTLDTELSEIMALRTSNRAKYNSREVQTRLAEIYTAKERHAERSGAN